MTLPNFLVVGPPRAGSTWLYHALAKHPDVFMAPEKELCFFQYPAYEHGIEWYERFFARWKGEARVGEASPNYLYFDESPELISRHLPTADIVMCLRDPVERLVSHFWHRYNRGDWSPMTDPVEILRDPPTSIAAPGFYARWVTRYLEHFPPEKVHIFFFDDLVKRPREFVRDLYARLGIEVSFLPQHAVQQLNEVPGVVPKFGMRRFLYERATAGLRSVNRLLLNRFPPHAVAAVRRRLRVGRFVNRLLDPAPIRSISDELRQQLREVYRDDIQSLATITNRDLSSWLGGGVSAGRGSKNA